MKTGQWLQIVFFILFIYSGAAMLWLYGGGDSAVSETENRALARMPIWSGQALRSGQYVRGLENYVADHVPFRETLVSAGKTVASWGGVSGKDDAVIALSGANNTAQTMPAAVPQTDPTQTDPAQTKAETPGAEQAATPKPDHSPHSAAAAPQTQEKPQTQDESGRIVGKVLIVGNRAMNVFAYAPASAKRYADTINRLERLVRSEAGIHVSVLLAPTAVEFVQNEKLRKLSTSQDDAIRGVYEQLSAPIVRVDALGILRKHSEEYIYFRTDHHWTATGAYYGYEAYMRALGVPPVPLERYERQQVPGFLGSQYSATLSKKLEKEPDTIVLYKPFVSHEYAVHYSSHPSRMDLLDMSHASRKNKYRIFLSGDRPWARIKTETDNGRRLAVIKDSYGNALIPFLLPHFAEIYVIDPRQFDQPLIPFLKEHEANELLVLNNTEVLVDSDFIRLIETRLQP
ncbi:DHHW family protein [Paenibacillus hamazuiensis]|uniref:DHHW family protein n=1 Tax=Paenibacillus hamazuiensis TaxID=2936508 RepID=UPI00200BF6DA|nr:DHHW family protein [Paenibacillus hamazuiensis]